MLQECNAKSLEYSFKGQPTNMQLGDDCIRRAHTRSIIHVIRPFTVLFVSSRQLLKSSRGAPISTFSGISSIVSAH